IIGSTVSRPSGPGPCRTPHGRGEGEDVWNAAHDPRLIKAVSLLQNYPKLPHEPRILKCGKCRIELCDKEGIIRRQCRNEGGVNGEIVLCRVTRPAGPPIPSKRLGKENFLSLSNQICLGR